MAGSKPMQTEFGIHLRLESCDYLFVYKTKGLNQSMLNVLVCLQMSEWCDLVTIHGVAGPSVMKGLQSGKSKGRLVGALIVAEMSSKDNLINKEYR